MKFHNYTKSGLVFVAYQLKGKQIGVRGTKLISEHPKVVRTVFQSALQVKLDKVYQQGIFDAIFTKKNRIL